MLFVCEYGERDWRQKTIGYPNSECANTHEPKLVDTHPMPGPDAASYHTVGRPCCGPRPRDEYARGVSVFPCTRYEGPV